MRLEQAELRRQARQLLERCRLVARRFQHLEHFGQGEQADQRGDEGYAAQQPVGEHVAHDAVDRIGADGRQQAARTAGR